MPAGSWRRKQGKPMPKDARKAPGSMTWDGQAWTIRARSRNRSLKIEIERTRILAGRESDPPIAALRALKAECEDELARRVAAKADPTTLTDLARKWMRSLQERGKTVAFAKTRKVHLERFILPRFGHLRPSEVTPQAVEAWKPWLLTLRTPKGQRYAHTTLSSVWATARAFFAFAAVQANIRESLMGQVRLDVKGRAKVAKSALTMDEVRAVLRYSSEHETPSTHAMFVVGFACGMRFSELSALEWGDVRLDKATLRIERSQVGGIVGEPKTEATRRDVYLGPPVVEALRSLRAWQMREQVPGLERGLLFPSRTGGYRYTQAASKALRRVAAAVGIDKHLSIHCMRKTCSNLYRQREDDAFARAVVGHATRDSTFTYGAYDEAERAAKFAAVLGPVFA